MFALYIMGGLLAVGMISNDLFSVFREDLSNAYGFIDRLQTFSFQLFQTIIFILLSFVLSWLAVGFLLVKSIQSRR